MKQVPERRGHTEDCKATRIAELLWELGDELVMRSCPTCMFWVSLRKSTTLDPYKFSHNSVHSHIQSAAKE